jgi:hypothetical protein
MKTLFVLAPVALACGGPQTKSTEEGTTTQGGGPADAAMASAWGGGAPDASASGIQDTGPGVGQPPGPPAPVTFVLENKGKGDLIFAIDQGWQPVLFAFTGKPPKAKSVILFPTHCTETCEAPLEAVCPECKEEEDIRKRKQQEKEETKREVAPEGGTVEVPWDGQILLYEKAPKGAGPMKRCRCWRKADPEPNTYTIKACGLRPSTEAGKPSKPVCAEAQVQLPPAEAPTRVTLSIP